MSPPASEISATEPDWSREKVRGWWDPGRRLLQIIRRYDRWAGRAAILASVWLPDYRFWSTVTGAEIPLRGRIAGGLLIPHPNGIVIHPDTIIGPNCLIFQQVTLGAGGPIPGTPILGGHVDIGAGAKILGGVRIGPRAKIGANAVVLQDVPEGATAVGVPARILPSGS